MVSYFFYQYCGRRKGLINLIIRIAPKLIDWFLVNVAGMLKVKKTVACEITFGK